MKIDLETRKARECACTAIWLVCLTIKKGERKTQSVVPRGLRLICYPLTRPIDVGATSLVHALDSD